MRRPHTPRSLGVTVVAGVLIGEFVFALALGVTMGAFSLIGVANEYEQAREQVTGTIVASLMPMVADQQPARVQDALQSIVTAADLQEIECVHVVDSSGATIAAHGTEGACLPDSYEPSASPWSVFTGSQLERHAIVVNDLEVATAYVRFARVPLSTALRTPAIASTLVVVSIMFISVPWTVWLVVRGVTDPLRELDAHASRIASGEYDVEVKRNAPGEIGTLQETVSTMALQLKERRAQLESSYEELSNAYDSLEEAKQQVEELARMKADFVAVAAHEIRTPLTAISLYAERLAAGEISDLDPAAAEAVTAIHSAATRLGTIASDLMDSALLERGLMPLQFGRVWLGELVEQAVRDARQIADIGGQSIVAPDEMPEMIVTGDPLRLRQVLDNLLSNAMKYSLPGTVVEVRASEDDDYVLVEVIDEGRGVPEAKSSQLFKLFGRLDFGASRETAGLGLGLAISARIVEAHGGTLSFRSNEKGQGSVFSMRLPVDGPAEEPQAFARLEEDG